MYPKFDASYSSSILVHISELHRFLVGSLQRIGIVQKSLGHQQGGSADPLVDPDQNYGIQHFEIKSEMAYWFTIWSKEPNCL